MKRIFKSMWTAALALLCLPLAANNIAVSNITIAERNDANQYIVVQFDLTWENSFRTTGLTPDNWDAAWCFVKFNKTGSINTWEHATLAAATNHVIPAGFEAVQPTDNLGVFIQRAAAGSGTATLTGVKLRWDYSAANLDPTNDIDVKVFAVEMVYIPQGAFKVGTGGTESGSLTDGSWTTGATIPYTVSSEDALNIGQSAGNLWGTSSTGSSTIGTAGLLQAAFPKGFAAFYCMKHELTQKAYCDFLNTLSRRQQISRVASDISGSTPGGSSPNFNRWVMTNTSSQQKRIGIRCADGISVQPYPVSFYCDGDGDNTGFEANDHMDVALSYLTAGDMLAWLDWAALRPMTELEYEKAARGPQNPVPNEYAWGSTAYNQITAIASGAGTAEELPFPELSSLNAAQAYNNPLRVGLGAGAATNRIQGGASFWGVLDLSGNVAEFCVSVGIVASRTYAGNHGNGMLTETGLTDTGWPDLCRRGGDFWNTLSYTMVCDRGYASSPAASYRWQDVGGRGVRTAP